VLWLHERGYNYFTLPKLTYAEIRNLTEAKGRQIKKKNLEIKKMEQKAKNQRFRKR